jgi:hypothetical protein
VVHEVSKNHFKGDSCRVYTGAHPSSRHYSSEALRRQLQAVGIGRNTIGVGVC